MISRVYSSSQTKNAEARNKTWGVPPKYSRSLNISENNFLENVYVAKRTGANSAIHWPFSLGFTYWTICTCMIHTDCHDVRVSVVATEQLVLQPGRKVHVDTEHQKERKRVIPSWFLPLLSGRALNTSPLSHPGTSTSPCRVEGQRNQWLLIKPKN